LTPWLGPTPPLWQTKTPGRKPRSASQRPDWGFLFWNNHDQLGLAKVSDSCVCEQTRDGAEASVSAATSSRGFLLMRLETPPSTRYPAGLLLFGNITDIRTVEGSANNPGPACRTLGWLAGAPVGVSQNVPGLLSFVPQGGLHK